MRQKNETATSFNQLKEITQAIQAQKRSAQTNANANTSEIASQSTLTPKTKAHAKKHALKPTKRAFSERQISAFRDNSQASDHKRLETQQSNQQGDNASANKSDEKNTRGQQ
ncbi:hypothetical protein EC598_06370 [Helicobacter pylori]|uniref:hypothetical protein n=1 Tax=Helicobacter pylori TaxID=210 RepID=UPI000FDEB77E|nr:hypothetical protein [Helicobacter pylori]RVZ87792.1 hypothetical protein EC598_06370 [Helicobacter pylori]